MRHFFSIIALLLVIAICPACSSDEPGDTSLVEGTWTGDDYDHFYSNVKITFKSDGTGTATIDHTGAFISIRKAQFTYKVKGKTVTTKGTLASGNSDGEADTQDFNNKYEVSGNKLKVVSGTKWYTNNVSSYRRQ